MTTLVSYRMTLLMFFIIPRDLYHEKFIAPSYISNVLFNKNVNKKTSENIYFKNRLFKKQIICVILQLHNI